MAISDNNPERRNLVLTSLAFIVFYAADGYMIDNTLNLSLINLSFMKPNVLMYFAWLMLTWFCLRFWQKSGFQYWASLTKEITSSNIPASINKYSINKARLQLDDEIATIFGKSPVKVSHWSYEGFFPLIVCDIKDIMGSHTHQELVKYNGMQGVFFTIKSILVHSFKNNAFSEELLPYILFIIAVTAPFWDAAI